MASNGLQVKVDAIDEDLLIEGIQKIANRITVGLILAAGGGGIALMFTILLSDHRGAKKAGTRERA